MSIQLTRDERNILAMLTYARLGNSFSPAQISLISNLVERGFVRRIVREGDVFYETIMSDKIREVDNEDYKKLFYSNNKDSFWTKFKKIW